MNLWTLPSSSASSCHAAGASLSALVPLVDHIGAPGFATAALAGLNDAHLQAASWSVYQLEPGRAPRLHLSASVGITDTTRDCFQVYCDSGLYRRDRSFDTVAPGATAVLRMHADQAPSSQHRERIYRRHGMVERLSVVRRGNGGALLAVNLYHHQHQGCFSEGEQAGFIGLAPLLLAAVQRHLALLDAAALAPTRAAAHEALGALPSINPGTAAPLASERERLHQRCPALTARELDVCERLLRGWSYDGIAADLGLSLPSVKTYRARAFARLGLHFRSELFALLRAGATPQQA